MQFSYRQIAKVLAHGMQLDGQEYSELIESYIKSIEAMPLEQRAALQAAYIFASKTHRDERQDVFQTIVAYTLTELAKYDGRVKDTEGFCYTVARHRWGDWWKQRKNRNHILNGGFISLNALATDGDKEIRELHEFIADDLNIESEVNSEIAYHEALNTLPDRVKAIVVKRLNYQKLSTHEYEILARYREENEKAIRELLTA